MILGIDPAGSARHPHGLALVHDGQLVAHMAARGIGLSHTERVDALHLLLGTCMSVHPIDPESITGAYIETWTSGKGEWTKNGAMTCLHQSGALWSGACDSLGLRVVRVNSQTWQAAFGLAGWREARKDRAIQLCRSMFGEDLTEDEADAALLALYGEREEIVARRVAGGRTK